MDGGKLKQVVGRSKWRPALLQAILVVTWQNDDWLLLGGGGAVGQYGSAITRS